MKKIPFGKPLIGENEKKEIQNVLEGTILTHGPKCYEFEKNFAEYIGVKYAVTTSNCTTAIHLSLEALGINEQDEVIVPAMTHVATAHAVEHVGAKPVFVDVLSKTGCVSPEEIEKAITPKTKAIIPVHFVGLPCDMDKINKIALKFNLKVVEDSATALGATFGKKKTGNLGTVGCFSFYPTKHITSMEGGMAVTNDADLALKISKKRAFGYNKNINERSIPGFYDIDMLGWNYRMSEGHAAIGLIQLNRLDEFLCARKKNAEIIFNILKSENLVSLIPLKYMKSSGSWYCINLMLNKKTKHLRNDLINAINNAGIQTSIHYPVSLPSSIYYSNKYGFKRDQFPNANKIAESTISLPCAPHLNQNEAEYIGRKVLEILNNLK